jgi:hypothetical protein
VKTPPYIVLRILQLLLHIKRLFFFITAILHLLASRFWRRGLLDFSGIIPSWNMLAICGLRGIIGLFWNSPSIAPWIDFRRFTDTSADCARFMSRLPN